MDAARVVEVWVPGRRRVGSGYLLADRLALTAYHVVQGAGNGARVEVRPLSAEPGPWLESRVCWPDGPVDIAASPERDAALLLIDAPQAPGPLPGPVRFGQVTGQDRVPCAGVGFPAMEKRADHVRDTARVLGKADPLHAFKSALLTIHIDEGVVPPRGGWAGASGTALFCGPLLIGVLATDRNTAASASVLGAVPITALAELPGFRSMLAQHGVELSIEPAPVPGTERLLAPYLEAVAKAAREHPYPGILPGRLPPLTAVYLRQDLRLSPAPEQADGDAAKALAQEIVLTADDVLADTGNGIVAGDPGGGKSSLLRIWAADLAGQFIHGHAGQVPVLVQAAALVSDHPMPLPDALAAAATAELSAYGLNETLPPQFFRTPPEYRMRWLVLVDGLDEVTAADRRRKLLNALAAQDPHLYRIVVATRPAAASEVADLRTAARYMLQPFTSEDLYSLAKGWFTARDLAAPDAAADDFLRALNRAHMDRLARNPLMASMLCQLYAHRPGWQLPQGRTALYTAFLDLLHEHRDAPGPGGLRAQTTAEMTRHGPAVLEAAHHVLDRLPELLEHLAAERHAGNAAPALDIIVTHPAAQTPGNFPPSKWHKFLHTSLRHSGLLTVRSGELAFLHETLLEYLAARHATRTPESRAHAIRQAFHHPRRYRPGDSHDLMIRPRLWGWRYWDPPPPEAESYIGFLIDTARDRDPAAGTRQLVRLASTRAGSPGEFICGQIQLGTRVPESAVRATADLLRTFATKRRFEGYKRLKAAEALAGLGDPRAADVWYALALGDHPRVVFAPVPDSDSFYMEAARALADLGDPRAADAWYALALDPHRVFRSSRVKAAKALAGLGDPRGADLLHALALDDPYRVFDSSRVAAARALRADHGDPRAADAWVDLAVDDLHRRVSDRSRTKAFRALLADLGDPRAADPLYGATLGDPHRLFDRTRVAAAKALAGLGDPRGADLLHALALDPHFTAPVAAAEALAGLGDPRGADALHALALDPHFQRPRGRVRAARALAGLGDPRAEDVWYDPGFGDYRVEAALAGRGDPRAADVWYALALDPDFGGYRVEAAAALAELGDPRAADV